MYRACMITIMTIGLGLLPLPGKATQTVQQVEADAIYVSPQGKAKNSGSKSSPVATMAQAFKLAKAGQTIYLRAGRYHGTEALRNLKGEAGKPITVSAYPGEQVIFDGSQDVQQLAAGESLVNIQAGGTGWLPHKGHIYKMQLQQDIWQLFVFDKNGVEQMVPARWPNAKFSDGSIYLRSAWATAKNALNKDGRYSYNPVMNKIKTGVKAKDIVDNCFDSEMDLTNLAELQKLDAKMCFGVSIDAPPEHKRQLSKADQELLKKRPWKSINNNADNYGHDLAAQTFDATGAMAILNYGHWRTWARPVVSHDGDSFSHIATPHLYGTGHYYYLEAALSLLDQEEEWFYDKNTHTLYLWAPNSIALNKQTLAVRAKVQANAFTIKNADYVTFKDLNFFATTFTCLRCDQMIFDQLNLQYAGSSRRMLKQWGQVSTHKSGRKLLIDATPDIVIIDGKYNSNSNNSSGSVIRNSSFIDSDGPALQFHGNDNQIINNRFTNIDYTGAEGWPFQAAINTFKGKNNTFSYNTFYNTGLSQMYRAHSGDITHNYVDNIGWAQTDGAAIGANNTGLAVAYNWAFSDHDKGIRIDAAYPPTHVSQWHTDNYIHHNVTMNNRGIVAKGWRHRIYNNTIIDKGYRDPVSGVVDVEPPRLVLNNDTALVQRFNVTEQQMGCKVGIDCGANLGTISANNLAPYILAGLGKRVDRKTQLLAEQHHDHETSIVGGVSVSELLRDPQNYDFRAKDNSPISNKGVALNTFSKTELYNDYQGLPDNVDYIGAYATNDKHYSIPGQRQALASFPIPLHGSNNAKIDSDLIWREALSANEYRLYFANSQQQLSKMAKPTASYEADVETYPGIRAANNIYTPEKLSSGNTYFWRVDVVVGEQVHKGKIWQFTVEQNIQTTNNKEQGL
ncbi:right-handed parallel beta-helix repeat-containing protein [Thalassotalea fonticola]|uniref:Right-handed parallel beta-helix repeat-containing protein n=1 Tax=Thalassotalea fonticola TaxID=3065649 RepID=A0ABZ0GQB6_9GAMM|nr:right-handed parallel beta-helix repeat-containing protein [Colwelliaceae bacterium S1-1]